MLLALAAAALCSGCYDDEASDPVIRFTEATGEAGLSEFRYRSGATGKKWLPETMGPGVAFLDANGDLWPDILAITGGSPDPNAPADQPALQLFLNDTEGGFTSAKDQLGLAGLRAYGFGLCAADHDNDGDSDVVLSALDGAVLLHNDDGVFRPERLDLGEAPGWIGAASFIDADADGRLDLFLSRYVDWSPANDLFCSNTGVEKSYCTPEAYRGLPPIFLRNTGTGFAEATKAQGLTGLPGKSLGVTVLDYDGDAWTDLFVANDTERDLLLRNRGDGTFEEIGRTLGVAYDEAGETRAGMGVATGYTDDTGQPSLFVTNFARETISVFRFDGSRIFTDRALSSGIGPASVPTLGFGMAMADFDLDGDPDLFVGNGHVHHSGLPDGTDVEQPPHLFVNDVAGGFADAVPGRETGLAVPMLARGVAHADYDRDGDIDLLVADNAGALRLWRNDTVTDGKPLRVRLTGTQANRDGIGARITVRAGNLSLHQVVTTCGSYQSSFERGATFGLPDGASTDIEVTWPGGAQTRASGVASGQSIRIVQGVDGFESLDGLN